MSELYVAHKMTPNKALYWTEIPLAFHPRQ